MSTDPKDQTMLTRPWIRGPKLFQFILRFCVNFTIASLIAELMSRFYSDGAGMLSTFLGRALFALLIAIIPFQLLSNRH